MKVFHINQFKCTLCSNWFCPPFNLPYRLKCTHSICTNCLEKSVANKSNQIICPEDLERNKISQINVNQSTKKALQRLLKEHRNFSQTNHLECIKSLSMNFDELLDSKEIELKNLSTLIDQIFENQIKRLRQIYEKIKMEINRPFRIVNDWKQVVRSYLKKVKSVGPSVKGCVSELNHYIEQGRKIKLDINEYLKYDFRQLIDHLLLQPQVCFIHDFSIFNKVQRQVPSSKFQSISKFQTLGKKMVNGKQICLQDVTNNFDQSSIRIARQIFQQPHDKSNKTSLFEELIQQTPKNSKVFVSHIYQDSKKTPLKEMMFSSMKNVKEGDSNGNWIKEGEFSDKAKINNVYTQISAETMSNYRGDQKDYNGIIKDKIKRLKAKNQQTSPQKINKMGKSLEYSPQQVHYSTEGFQNYVVQASYDSNSKQSYTNNKSNKYQYQHSTSPNFHQNSAKITNFMAKLDMQDDFDNKQRKQSEDQDEEMLLDQKSNRKNLNDKLQKRNGWELENINFLKQWRINKNAKPEEELEIIQKYGGYNCEKEKNKYARKIQENKVRQLLKQAQVGQNYISLVGHSLADCNLTLFLSQIDWNYRNIEIVKLIKTSLSDNQLNELLNFLVKSNVHTLMLSYNNLSEFSLDALLNFVNVNEKLKNIYLPKNNISLLKGNARAKINLLKQKGLNMYI